ncbi:MAG: hypothetical protein WBV61_03130 [Rhodanobacteraceae bacterium]
MRAGTAPVATIRATGPVCRFGLVLLAWMLIAPARGGDKVEPPLEALYAAENTLVVGKLMEVKPAGRLVFATDKQLGGKSPPPARIDVRVPKSTLAQVKVGDRYIFAYSLYRRDSLRADRAIYNREGAVMLASPGLEPALFQDDRSTRAILSASRNSEAGESGRLLRLLLEALRGKDAALQNLAANEIALDPDLAPQLTPRDREVIERLVGNAHALPSARSALLLAASRDPAHYGDWWAKSSRKILATTPTGGYANGATDPSGLVLLAFEVLDLHKIELPSSALKRWVGADSPALAEKALLAMRRQSPAEERPAISKALADPHLPPATRKFLNDHLRRLNLLDARLHERKGGIR